MRISARQPLRARVRTTRERSRCDRSFTAHAASHVRVDRAPGACAVAGRHDRDSPARSAVGDSMAEARRRWHAVRELRGMGVPGELHRARALSRHARAAKLEHASRRCGSHGGGATQRAEPCGTCHSFIVSIARTASAMFDTRDVIAGDALVQRAGASGRCRGAGGHGVALSWRADCARDRRIESPHNGTRRTWDRRTSTTW